MTFVSFGSAQVRLYWKKWQATGMEMSYLMLINGTDSVHLTKAWVISSSAINSTSLNVTWSAYPEKDVSSFVVVCIANNSRRSISAASATGKKHNLVVINLLKSMWYKVFVLAVLGNSTTNTTNWNERVFKSQSVMIRTMDGVYFIKVPPSIIYVSLGQNAKLVWEYAAENKKIDFDVESPRWEVYNSNNGWKTIGADHGSSGWKWKLSSSCPARLQNPTRVTKASPASLIIYNVTIEDSGIYRCNITLKHRQPITSTTRLIVTDRPHFSHRLPGTMNIAEGQRLYILCSAVGLPAPHVTWVKVQGNSRFIVSKELGSAALSLPNIKRTQNGIYECQALNNQNESPVKTQTKINVMYPPSIDYFKSDTTVLSVAGIVTRLRCVVSGSPVPNVTWYGDKSREPIKGMVRSFTGFNDSEVIIDLGNTKRYKNYRCFAENVLGYCEHNITVLPNESNVDQNFDKPRETINYGRDPVVITCVIIITVLKLIIIIGGVFIFKVRGNLTNKKDLAQEDIINMGDIAIAGSTDADMRTSEQIVREVDIGVDLPGDSSSSLYYQIPRANFGQVSSTSTSPSNQYQELDVSKISVHNYQSLQDIRTAADNTCFESETSNV